MNYIYSGIISIPIFYYIFTRPSVKAYCSRLYLLGWIIQYFFSRYKGQPVNFTICDSGKAGCLTYTRHGNTYMLAVPYNRRLLSKTMDMRVFLVKDTPFENTPYKEIEITQQPGIPYLVTPDMLGGKYFKVILQGQTFQIEHDQYLKIEDILSQLEE